MKINFKAGFLFFALFPSFTWANEAEAIPVQGICEELRKGASWTVVQYFNGVTKDEQYINIDRVLPIEESPDENKIYKNEEALEMAQNLFYQIELHSRDTQKRGYLEAFTRNWEEIEDLRLSEKDANEKKTMNTHLHIVEAYANLYLVWPNQKLKEAIKEILEIVDLHFIDKTKNHLKLFFDENWVEKEDVISYGHDIEAAWLLQWCAEAIKDL